MIIIMSYFILQVLYSVGTQTEKDCFVSNLLFICVTILFGTVAVIELNIVVQ